MHKKSGVVWRKRMRLLARDLKPVTLMKVNGDLYHGIRVNLQSSVEKKIAHNTQVINNYINNFYAEVSDIDMQQGQ